MPLLQQRRVTAPEDDWYDTDTCPGRVILAEDDRAMRELLEIALRRRGYEVVAVRDGLDLLGVLEEELTEIEQPPAGTVIISDVRMPRVDGLYLLERIRALGWKLPVILVTAFGDAETHDRARALDAHTVMDKPFDLDVLLDHVAAALVWSAAMSTSAASWSTRIALSPGPGNVRGSCKIEGEERGGETRSQAKKSADDREPRTSPHQNAPIPVPPSCIWTPTLPIHGFWERGTRGAG
jgi:CheY-like chemotaxis protein